MSIDFNPHIFREYDIRGHADEELPDPLVEALGHAFAARVRSAGCARVAIGRDCRISSPRVAAALARGIAEAGLDVVTLGMVPTPLLYFAVHTGGFDAGIQVTGSHNPPEYNGFKMMVGHDTLHGSDVLELRAHIEAGDRAPAAKSGSVTEEDITEAYLDFVCGNITMGPRKLRVVIDGGNGAGGELGVRLYRRLGADVIGECIEPDGTFPNHHPDPTNLEAVAWMRRAVLEHRADLAIGYDGDADRMGVVDHAGDVQWGDRLMILFSRALLKDEPGARIVGEVKCSKTLFDDIRAHGGHGEMWKVGHSLIKARMRETGALLAGEMSGHIFFKHRFFGFDDGLYAGARLLELLSHEERRIDELLSDVPETWVTPEIRRPCPDGIKFAVVARVVEILASRTRVIDIDGARAEWEDGWGLVRASNTQPVVVLRVEAESAHRRDEILTELQSLVSQAESDLS